MSARRTPALVFVVGVSATLAPLTSNAAAAAPSTHDFHAAAAALHESVLTPATGGTAENLGSSVAVSGHTVVVGGCESSQCPDGTGAVYVFNRPGKGWKNLTPVAQLSDSGFTGLYYGEQVAIDGDTIVTSAFQATVGANSQQGQVEVFTKPAGGWKTTTTPSAILTTASGHAGDELGASVAIDGATIVAGAPERKVNNANGHGAAYVFTEPPGGWATTNNAAGILYDDSTVAEAGFGTPVAISGDTIVIGARFENPSSGGLAWVFTKPPTGWADNHNGRELDPSDTVGSDYFGAAVAIDGDTVAVGAPDHYASPSLAGEAYVFTKPMAGWGTAADTALTESAILTNSAHPNDSLGSAVAVHGDAVLAGAPSETINAKANAGAVFAFAKPAAGWSDEHQSAAILPGDPTSTNYYGSSVAYDGTTIVAGAYGRDAGHGAAYVYAPPAPRLTALKVSKKKVHHLKISFTIDQGASVTVTVKQHKHGHYKSIGSTTRHKSTGHHSFLVSPHIEKKVKTGKYHLSVKASNANGDSSTETLKATVH